MKSAILVASAGCFVGAQALLGLGLADVDLTPTAAKAGVDLGAVKPLSGTVEIEIALPHNVKLDNDHKPTGPPPDDCINIFHPPHVGVTMDGCDRDHDGGWHYVHPCKDCDANKPPTHVWATTTMDAAPPLTTGPAGGPVSDPTPCTTVVPVRVTTPSTDSVPTGPATGPGVGPTSVPPPVLDTTTVRIPIATLPIDPLNPDDDCTSTPTLPATAAVPTVTPSVENPPAAPTAPPHRNGVPSRGFSTVTAGVDYPQPSGPAIYPVPSNQTGTTYTPPSPPSPERPGCAGEGCHPINVGPPGAGSPSTGSVFPQATMPLSGASRQTISIFLFAGTAAAFACLL